MLSTGLKLKKMYQDLFVTVVWKHRLEIKLSGLIDDKASASNAGFLRRLFPHCKRAKLNNLKNVCKQQMFTVIFFNSEFGFPSPRACRITVQQELRARPPLRWWSAGFGQT